jgi:hypothetical protein
VPKALRRVLQAQRYPTAIQSGRLCLSVTDALIELVGEVPVMSPDPNSAWIECTDSPAHRNQTSSMARVQEYARAMTGLEQADQKPPLQLSAFKSHSRKKSQCPQPLLERRKNQKLLGGL